MDTYSIEEKGDVTVKGKTHPVTILKIEPRGTHDFPST
jgi:hypothetical protein